MAQQPGRTPDSAFVGQCYCDHWSTVSADWIPVDCTPVVTVALTRKVVGVLWDNLHPLLLVRAVRYRARAPSNSILIGWSTTRYVCYR